MLGFKLFQAKLNKHFEWAEIDSMPKYSMCFKAHSITFQTKTNKPNVGWQGLRPPSSPTQARRDTPGPRMDGEL